MNGAFQVHEPVKAYVLALQLAYANGKQPGQGMAEEFLEVANRHPSWLSFLGNTEDDAGMITGNLRENGIKVLNLNEHKKENNNA